jgi:hypothetical protein
MDSWFFFLSFPRCVDYWQLRVRKKRRTSGKKVLRLIQIRLAELSLAKIPTASQEYSLQDPNWRFKFHKRSQLFIRTHNETLSVAAMRVCNPDGSSLGING